MVHPPPTGKHCRNVLEEEEEAPITGGQSSDEVEETEEIEDRTEPQPVSQAEMMKLLMSINDKVVNFSEKMENMDTRVQNIEERGKNNEDRRSEGESAGAAEQLGESLDKASPESLRKDLKRMRLAAAKLASLTVDDSDEEEINCLPKNRANGKKSGAHMTAADHIENRMDWPHFYVHRMSGGRRKGLTFSELRVEEFVFGFLAMLKAKKGKWVQQDMLDLLQNMMQDTMEFSWGNAVSFFETMETDMEKGTLKWVDLERIRELRMTYARTVFPQKKEVKEGFRGAPQPATAGMKCCMAFQKHACEMDRDHHPFTHGCHYCFRTKTLLCRHPEEECIRKNSDVSKNVK